MGDDLPAIEAALREGRATPFSRWQPAVDYGARCQLIGHLSERPLSRFSRDQQAASALYGKGSTHGATCGANSARAIEDRYA